MRQMMFSTVFPAYHPKAGQPTKFPEKLWAGWAGEGLLMDYIDLGTYPMDFHDYHNAAPKLHTIREGNRWKIGDVFIPKIWSGKPYRSKTITIGPPIEVRQVWAIGTSGCTFFWPAGIVEDKTLERICRNDGLEWKDFWDWFKVPASKNEWIGQIICWSDKVKY